MREMAGVDSDIFYSWALNFVEETKFLRRDDQKLLVFYGFSRHIQFRTLNLLKEN